jgi:hypothetical protein
MLATSPTGGMTERAEKERDRGDGFQRHIGKEKARLAEGVDQFFFFSSFFFFLLFSFSFNSEISLFLV